jgi:uncharacterized oxidoreductase
MNLTGNTIFIPGATSGIGLGLALRFHDLGNTVIVGGRRTELLAQIEKDHPGIHTIEIDTAEPDSITSARDSLVARFPALNVLIPMAGIMLPENLRTADYLDIAERTVTINLLGPIRLIAAFTEHLSEQVAGTIMTVSSGLAFVPLPYTPTYNATKSGIHAFTEILRLQLADTCIQVIELVPPGVRTTLMNQEESETAMPLEAFLDEVIGLLGSEPDADEILVENVKFLRHATANGNYDEVLAMLSGH